MMSFIHFISCACPERPNALPATLCTTRVLSTAIAVRRSQTRTGLALALSLWIKVAALLCAFDDLHRPALASTPW